MHPFDTSADLCTCLCPPCSEYAGCAACPDCASGCAACGYPADTERPTDGE